jgi:5'-3' exonuclease
MGINNLNKILKRHSPGCYVEVHLYKYAFQKIAIDTSLFMYKYKTIFGERWLNAFINMICCLRKNEIHPIFIFDSKAPPEKLEEQQTRREQRQKIVDKLEQLEIDYKVYKETGNVSDLLQEICNKTKPSHPRLLSKSLFDENIIIEKIEKLKLQTISITSKDFDLVKELFKIMKIPYYDATSEAEATGAYLSIQGEVVGVLTADTDVLAYGVTKFLCKLNVSKETCIEIDTTDMLKELDMTQPQFTDMCIMCGTDYNKNIPKIGPHKSYSLMKQYKSIEEMKANTDIDISILKHQRTRELFSFYENYFEDGIKHCGSPDFGNIEKFLFKHNCYISVDYIKQCLESKEINFE